MPDFNIRQTFTYLRMAEALALSSPCLRKQFGAIIVRDDLVVSTGVNTSPNNCPTCAEQGGCYRILHDIPRGTDYASSCRSIHAEMIALINADASKLKDSVMYLYGWDREHAHIVRYVDCCSICKRMIINSGIRTMFFADEDKGIPAPDEKTAYKAKIVQVADWTGPDCNKEIMGAY